MKKTLIFFIVGTISLFLGYKTKQILSPEKIYIPPNQEIIVEMEALPAPPTQPTNLSNDQAIYQAHCAGCHDSGAAGAPKLGNKSAWSNRIIKGMPILLQHVSQGYNLMPPKGTCLECSNADLEAATRYLIKKSK